MQYFGGRHRIAGKISDFLYPFVLARGCYIEPFAGGGSTIAAQTGATVRIAGDANIALVRMWEALAAGWAPPETVTEETYNLVARVRDPNDPMTAFCGFGCSFAGKWFGGYARDVGERNYAKNAASSLRKKIQRMKDVLWHAGDYTTCPLLDASVIYCDPPYLNTTQYGAIGTFDSHSFWSWCRDKSKEGHAVFVSEYSAPDDFRAVLTINTKTDIRTTNGKERREEKLFVPIDQHL